MLDEQLTHTPPVPLVRSLGVMGVLFLTLSVTTPASSVFVIVPGMLQSAGTGAIWAVLIAGVICVATAYVYAELSSAWPVAGGEYVMVAHTLGPLAGFVMLGINVFNNLLFPPVIALGVAEVLARIWPGLPTIPVAIAVIAGSTAVSVLNIRVNAWITGIFLLIEVLTLAVVAAFGFAHDLRPLAGMLAHPVTATAHGMVPTDLASIGIATSVAIFAFNGYGAAVYFGEEMHEAPRTIARAILAALLATLMLVGLPILALLVGANDLGVTLLHSDPFGLLLEERGGTALADWVSIGVVVAIINAIIAAILATARFFYGSARDRSWGRPLDRWMTAIHPQWGSPWIGTLLVGGFMIAACFLPLRFLSILSGTGLIVIYAGIALAVMVGRRRGLTARPGTYRMPLYPVAPAMTLAALALLLWATWLDLEEGRPGLIVTAAQIALSAGYYWLVLRRRGAWTVHIPD